MENWLAARPMSYPFVRAAHDYGRAKGPRLALVVHMAEGGGTVGYLARPNPNAVSVHFVVERSGSIVQMLPLTHANGSIRPTKIRMDDDPPYEWQGAPVVYGATAAHTVLGPWWRDPTSATLGVEIEGYAKDGPSARQQDALAGLWADLADRFPGLRALAHRDFADYKACPGRLIPWDRLSGHGPEVVMPTAVNATDRTLASSHARSVKAGTTLYRDTAGTVLIRTGRDLVADDFGYPIGPTGWVYLLVRASGFDTDSDQEVGLALAKAGDVGPLRRKTPDELATTAAKYATPGGVDLAAAIADVAFQATGH